eukprot:CAMPEP_0174820314 /NCGR_PEP_ID=MMETSP1107-20130205/4048_1 /TAXON_ID=36770 /ORGANISM="Paraphysomonas vestita, Strain GFlagA" /LENGTH=202 /DNA_ID=CAMNT_0016035377 /DNA_START=1156 /DNA_END=1764 /DNA_ORIENTATION=+
MAFSSLKTVGAAETKNLGSVDHYFEDDRIKKQPGQPNQRDYTYLVLGGGRLLWASGARLAAITFISMMNPAADVLALASAEFETESIPVGSTITVKWRGKPIFIRHRTEEEIAQEAAVNIAELRHPETDQQRAVDPEWLIVIGICTHLGCVPLSNAGDYGGWFCPCHGSHYDVSGRIRKGPAPLNLEIPPYVRTPDGKLVIG